MKNKNRLIYESSPYLLQHACQPVDWYPWCDEAFEYAKEKDLPVLVSIGYSTCHWCHVMAHESFDDEQIAALLNERFVAVKVDREERPDVDSIYMKVCQAMTGSGGWPLNVFLTPDRKPFFAGTYFPKDSRQGMIGFRQLLNTISEKWKKNRKELARSADEIVEAVNPQENAGERSGKNRQDKNMSDNEIWSGNMPDNDIWDSDISDKEISEKSSLDKKILNKAVEQFTAGFDKQYGGFGTAPKFPTPHNLLFLLDQYGKTGKENLLEMVEKTLKQMYKGGLFDHIGFGFSRYSTDREFLVPHFEKMLYDNALLIMAYAKAYDVTENEFYREAAEQTAEYLLREMKHKDGGFYSAQDADSEGVEGRYYVFTPEEISRVLGDKRGKAFCRCYGITEEGNFEGKSIVHLTGNEKEAKQFSDCLPKLREYRRSRSRLHLDDKILTAWNGLAIAAFAQLYRVTGNTDYLETAAGCERFLRENLYSNRHLYVSYRNGARSGPGYLDDYAFMVFALLELYQAAQEAEYLEQAQVLCRKAICDFWDDETGGFYLSGRENEELIFRTKESYDGAVPSGNSVMAYNLVRLSQMTDSREWETHMERQLEYLAGQAALIPMGHAFFLLALSAYLFPAPRVAVALQPGDDKNKILNNIPLEALITALGEPTEEYSLKDGRTTYYVCMGHTCLPPSNNFFYKWPLFAKKLVK